MPVVEAEISSLVRLSGVRRDALLETLPHLGLDIESSDSRGVRVEYSPNRPDYATEYGIAQGLRGLVGAEAGSPRLPLQRRGAYSLRADRAPRERPVITAIAARGGVLGERGVRQLVSMQEDLHAGIGRRRRAASIGLHNIDAMRFPLEYAGVSPEETMAPLGSKRVAALSEVLEATEQGAEYGHLLEGAERVPALADAQGKIVSFPPIINSSRTAITPATRGILAEVTGTSRRHVEDALSVVAATLAAAGFGLHEVGVSGGGNATPRLEPRRMQVRAELVCETLGVSLSPKEIADCIRKSRIDATASGKKIACSVPRHRFDIIGEMDLVEEALLGMGLGAMGPELPAQGMAGSASTESSGVSRVSACMVGLGHTEVVNTSLVGEQVLHGLADGEAASMPAVASPKSRAHTTLRPSLVPGLLDVLSRNVHEPYPQRLFEVGTAFARAEPVAERTVLAAASAHSAASFTEAKSAAAAVLRLLGHEIATRAAPHAAYAEGHSADIVAGGRAVGTIGDVGAGALARLRIREPVAAFEIDLGPLWARPGPQPRKKRVYRKRARAGPRGAPSTKG